MTNWTVGRSDWGEESSNNYRKQGKLPHFVFSFRLPIVLTKYRKQPDENWEERRE